MIVNQNDQRLEEINHRITAFQILPTQPISKPTFKMRPVSTRRDILPCVERRRFGYSEPFTTSSSSPSSPCFSVDIESQLIPRKSETVDYIPNSTSDLYKTPIVQGRQEQLPFLLWNSFEKQTTIPPSIAKLKNKEKVFYNRGKPLSL